MSNLVWISVPTDDLESLKQKAKCWDRLVTVLRVELGMTEWIESRVHKDLGVGDLSLYDEVEMFILNTVNKDIHARAETTEAPRPVASTSHLCPVYPFGWDG